MHSIVDKQPEAVTLGGHPLSALVIFHQPDWRGYATIRWFAHSGVEEVSIRAPWLLQGFIKTEGDKPLPLEVACRAVALAAMDNAVRRVREAVESINLLELSL